ncbi:hypothetical protein E2562_000081 [Oryza meyeriana var. granulata]|uniref:Uncharacterized protein n=1 Tax=Oryza meyeriana var. granulata TaxID=110450 RepID=A0A6G1DAG6_9ORYZ|nr:hypothetical protein E2562_000081 [Oryza meyeriana var. granulata]
MPPPAQEPWAILAAIPNVVGYKEAKRIFRPGTDISVARNEVPWASVLTVPPHISLPACLRRYPYVAAADRPGPAPPPRHASCRLRLRHDILPHLRCAHRRGSLPSRVRSNAPHGLLRRRQRRPHHEGRRRLYGR